MSVTQHLFKEGLIKPPRFVHANIAYETIMGSEAYGCADTSNKSDTDIYGFCIPDKGLVFPHLVGHIDGFGAQREKFNVWQQHHIVDKNNGGLEYDLSIYGIVQYFALCMDCNPNMVDSLFTPERCVQHRSNISRLVRDNRKLFLNKKAWHTFRGYAHQQHNKMMYKGRQELREFQERYGLVRGAMVEDLEPVIERLLKADDIEPDEIHQLREKYRKLLSEARKLPDNPKRAASVEAHGYDVKFFYHIVRLMDEVEQILTEFDIDLERSREVLKAIRRGEWSYARAQSYLGEREKQLEGLYDSSKIPHSPDENAIKQLLMNCLEEHFGSLSGVIVQPGAAESALQEIQAVLDKNSAIFR